VERISEVRGLGLEMVHRLAVVEGSGAPIPSGALWVLARVTSNRDRSAGTVPAGLQPGRSYIVDADPLPCMPIEGGPSQSFPKALKADASGRGNAVWTVPNGMAGSVSVQGLTSRGTFAVLACADLTQ
jgi:hypothetical protein